jgi:hypothetical protein
VLLTGFVSQLDSSKLLSNRCNRTKLKHELQLTLFYLKKARDNGCFATLIKNIPTRILNVKKYTKNMFSVYFIMCVGCWILRLVVSRLFLVAC